MKRNIPLITGACLAALLVCAPSIAPAKEKKASSASPEATATPDANASTSTEKSEKSNRPMSYRGTIASADQDAKTFTVAGPKDKTLVLKITEKTVITKQGAPATIKDVADKEEVRGSYWKQADGTLEAKSVKIGPMSEEEKAKRAAHSKKKSDESAEAAPSATP